MSKCHHQWEMTNVKYGFVTFDKCFRNNAIKTNFSSTDTPGEEYREGDCIFIRVENAQSFTFDLHCTVCNRLESFKELMGLLQCTDCLPECPVEVLQKEYAIKNTWIFVAFGYLPEANTKPIPDHKLDILTVYFNQRRDTSRSKIKIVPFNLIQNLSRCKGEFIHDVGMLSAEPPPQERKPLL